MDKVLEAKVIKNGNSQAISLNKLAAEVSNFNIGDELILNISDEKIIVTKKKNSLKDEIREFYNNGGKYEEELVDFGDAVGEEW